MAEVNVIAPDGTPGTLPEEELQAALSDGFRLDSEAPALGPAQPAPALDEVEVRAPDGTLGTVARGELEAALADGFERADTSVGEQFATGAEGLARGATLGASDVVQAKGAGLGAGLGNYLADLSFGATPGVEHAAYDPAAADAAGGAIQERREKYPTTALATEVVSAVAPALVSGGTSTLAGAARMLPTAIEANLGAKLATALGAKAASWGAGKAIQLGTRAAATGLESAADVAIRTVLDDAANGDVDVTAERMLDHAWSGLTTGSALELGMAGLGAGARAAGRGAKRAVGALAERLPSVTTMAGEAAYKAAVGRTNRASQKMAERYGGAAAVGETLLRKDLVRAGDTVDDIAERLPVAREAAGQRLSALLDEVGEGTTSRAAVMQRIEDEVIRPLDVPGKKDVADAVRNKLKASGMVDELSLGTADQVDEATGFAVPADPAMDGITLRDLHTLRRAFDDRPDLRWSSAATADISLDAMRDVRRVIEDSFERASDEVAKGKGTGDFLARLKQAKRDYSHLALAAKQSEEGVMAMRANNRMGLNDVLASVGGAAALGPMGLATGVASQIVRPRFEATVAAGLYRMGRKAEAPTMLGRLAENAAEAQERLVRQADSAVRGVLEPERRAAARTAIKLTSAREIQRATDKALALQNPDSPEAKHFDASVAELASQDPDLAAALRDKVMARSGFIASKTAPPIDPADPLQRNPGRVDAQTARRNGRYVQAAMNPQAALERLSAGVGSAEDIETLRALTPRLYEVFVQRAMQRVKASKRAPTTRERLRLAYMLGQPLSSAGESIAWYQGLQAPADKQASENPNMAPATPRAKVNTDLDPRDDVYASRTDQIMAGS